MSTFYIINISDPVLKVTLESAPGKTTFENASFSISNAFGDQVWSFLSCTETLNRLRGLLAKVSVHYHRRLAFGD